MRRPAILVTRPDDSFSQILRENGFEVVNLELIRTVPVEDRAELEVVGGSANTTVFLITSPRAAAAVVVSCLENVAREH